MGSVDVPEDVARVEHLLSESFSVWVWYCKKYSLELPKESPGGELPGFDSQEVNLSGTYDVGGIIWRAGIEREGCPSARCGSRVGTRYGLSGGKSPSRVDVNCSRSYHARAIGAELARADL